MSCQLARCVGFRNSQEGEPRTAEATARPRPLSPDDRRGGLLPADGPLPAPPHTTHCQGPHGLARSPPTSSQGQGAALQESAKGTASERPPQRLGSPSVRGSQQTGQLPCRSPASAASSLSGQ